jgi:hypothetical protein
MKFLYSLFLGAGVAGLAYTRLGRRVGYGNQQNVWIIVGVAFVLASVIFYTVFAIFLNK